LEAIDNLGTLVDTVMFRLGHTARTLVWVIVALVCALLASVLGMTALIVSLWDTQHLMSLVAPAIGFAVFALLFGVIAARTLRAAPGVAGGTIVPGNVDGWLTPDGHATPSTHRHHPLAWIVALASLLFLGGSRELLALALRFRAVLALIAHALHVLRLFSRRQAPRRP
jgi:hypothetical protein